MATEDIFEFYQQNLQSDSYFHSTFERMWKNGEFTDVTIRIEDRKFHGHRMILAAVFPYFSAMFRSKMSDSLKEEITIQSVVDPDAFDCLMHYAYTGKIRIIGENVQQLLTAADYLQLADVRTACLDFLSREFRLDNVLSLLLLGDRLGCNNTVEKANSFIAENFDALYQTEEFLSIPFWLVKEIVSGEDLHVDNVENVFEAVCKWVNAQPERITMLIELLTFIHKKYVPEKRSINGNEQQSTPKKVKQRSGSLLDYHDMPYAKDDVFGIYAVCSSPSYGRIVHNYNSYTHTWQVVAKHCRPRCFTNVVSASGLIYAFTRENLEVFDRHSWTPSGFLPWPVRSRSGNAVTHGSKIYWFPNISNEICSVWCFDTESQTWIKETPSVKVISAGLVSLWNFIYILGGITSCTVTAVARTYDPYYKEFNDIPPMLSRRSSPGCANLKDRIYVCGGYNGSFFLDAAEVYDPLDNQWQSISRMRNQRSHFSLVPCDGRLYAVGVQANVLGTVDVYDPEKKEWTRGPEFPVRSNSLKALAICP